MIFDVYAVRDVAASAYLQPVYLPVPGDGMAIRNFVEAVSNKETPIGRYPDQYFLFHLCQYDDFKGEFIPNKDGPRSLGPGTNYLEVAKEVSNG